MSTIKALHAKWADKVMPAGAPQIQRQEMERAFYSGFFSALAWQLAEVAALPDAEAERLLAAGHEECELYFRTLAKATRNISSQ